MSAFSKRLITSAPLEIGLLAFVTIALLLAASRIVIVGQDAALREDLAFQGTLDRLDTLMVAAAPRGFARMSEASFSVDGVPVAVDTFALLLDSAVIPSVAKGGFLYDQINRLNRAQILNGLKLSSATQTPQFASGAVFTLSTSDSGTTELSSSLDPFSLRVASPFTSTRNGTVRTVDWAREPTLVGVERSTRLYTSKGLTTMSIGTADACTVSPFTMFGPRAIYCGGTTGSSSGTFYDLLVSPVGSWVEPDRVRISAYRSVSARINGIVKRLGSATISSGDVVSLQRTGAFIYSVEESGILASQQWTNGQTRFVNSGTGTLSPFARAGSRWVGVGTSPTVTLSLDERFNRDLDEDTKQFLGIHAFELERMAVVVIDATRGSVRAVSEASFGPLEPLRSFEPLLVGSIVKPILGAAIIAGRPELHDLQVNYSGESVTDVAGHPLRKAFSNHANGCSGTIRYNDFIRCSSNQYAAELVFRSLKPFSTSSDRIPRDVLERSELASGLTRIFDVDPLGNRTRGRLDRTWAAGEPTEGQIALISDRTLIPWESRPWLLFEGDSATDVDWIARYSFGGWENRWTLFGLAEAYARIASGKEVRMSFLESGTPADTTFALFKGDTSNALSFTRSALREVPVTGTASGVDESFRAAVSNSQNFVVMAKTGTLDEPSDSKGRRGTFIKTLVIAAGLSETSSASSRITCGLVVVSYFQFRPDWRQTTRASKLPNLHVEFSRGPLATTLGRNWGRVTHCKN